MEILCAALVFFPIVFVAYKFGGDRGMNIAMIVLVFGSLAFIVSLPVLCYLLLHYGLALL